METNRLRQFKVVAELENLRKAAEILRMSHSALSKSLKVLCGQLGKDLLIPRGRNIEITETGREILAKIDTLLVAEESLLKNEIKKENAIRVATFEVFSTHLLGARWNDYFPSGTLELRELLPGQLEKAVVEGASDFGLTYEPIPTAGLEFTLMGEVKMGIYGLRKKFGKSDFSNLPFVTPISPIVGTPTGAKGLDGWPESEFPRQSKYRVDMMESGLALARSGTAVIFAPDFVIKHHNACVNPFHRLDLLASPPAFKKVCRKIFLVSKRNAKENGPKRILAKLVRKECLSP